ncbi:MULTISPECIES: hypothetical protein [unclassified Sphingobacterium]|uniref:hypothetical protein n=1 Tax=unclassified Sphingobacterium TaxID=2609468 RepID=UPI0025CCA26E|nr:MULTISPECIES: hypothetical protein [unclassified Sphingobacterium]
MKTIVREHPLKDIILEFDESKTQPDFEKEALATYYEAHDEVYALKQRLDILAEGLADADAEVANLYMEALALEQSLEIIEDFLGLSAGDSIPDIEGEITIDVAELFEDIRKHHDVFQQLYLQIDDLTKKYNFEMDLMDPDDEFQENWPIHSRYFTVFDKVFPRYEELSVDIVSIDDDQETFRGVYGELLEIYNANLALAEWVFANYKNLFDLVEPMYERTSVAIEAMNKKMRDELGDDY